MFVIKSYLQKYYNLQGTSLYHRKLNILRENFLYIKSKVHNWIQYKLDYNEFKLSWEFINTLSHLNEKFMLIQMFLGVWV